MIFLVRCWVVRNRMHVKNEILWLAKARMNIQLHNLSGKARRPQMCFISVFSFEGSFSCRKNLQYITSFRKLHKSSRTFSFEKWHTLPLSPPFLSFHSANTSEWETVPCLLPQRRKHSRLKKKDLYFFPGYDPIFVWTRLIKISTDL